VRCGARRGRGNAHIHNQLRKNPVAARSAATYIRAGGTGAIAVVLRSRRKLPMKIWNKPQVREQEVGLEVTSYMPAEIDII